MKKLLTLFTLVVIGAPASAAGDATSISFTFPTVELGEVDQRTLERYLRRSGTFRCDLVEFEVQRLIELIEALDRGKFDVADSSVHLAIFGSELGAFKGIHFELGREQKIHGPYSWGGVLKHEPQISVSFIVDRTRIATMILDTGEFVYRTQVSRSSGHYFLCKTDGTRPLKRID